MRTESISAGGGFRHHLRKLFILYVAFATGCSNTTDQYVQSKAVENRSTPVEQVVKKEDLPDLGSDARAKQDIKDKKLQSVSAEALEWMKPDAPQSSDMRIADPRVKGFEGMDEFENMAMGIANSAAAQAVENWFGGYRVTAAVELGVGSGGMKTGSFDLLVPVYDAKKDLVFLQGGARRSNLSGDTRSTINLGAGYRRTFNEWMVGFNTFYDRDLTGRNQRIGFGAEAWTENLKLSANSYHRLSDWKKSPDLDDYLERPANGWDVRAEGYLPEHPQFGARVMYEQYYGDEVGLFGSGSRQKDPSAVTVGVIYNPVPLLNVSADYRQGQGGESDASIKLGINYKIGEPLAKQLSADSIISARKLDNARYNLVQRNNEIVLDYKRSEDGQILLPAQVRGLPGNTLSFPVTVTNRGIQNITWTSTGAAHAQAYNGSGSGTFNIPSPASASYMLQAVGTGPSGAPVMSNVMLVNVDAMSIALESSKTAALADGTDAVTFTATVRDPEGQLKPQAEVKWAVAGPATVTSQEDITDNGGRARLRLVSTQVASISVEATEPTGAKADAGADFTLDPTTARVVGVVATPTTILANGTDSSTLVATVEDNRGVSIGPGIVVSWSTTRGSVSPATSVTDNDGKATASLTGTQIGAATVMASAAMGSDSAVVTLITDTGTSKVVSLTASPSTITANGVETSTLTAKVEDANGNPVGAGITVSWGTTKGDLSAPTSVTDANGYATVTLSGTEAGAADVTAAASAGSANTTVNLVPDASSARVVGLVAVPSTISANGVDASTLTATVEDAFGNAVGAGVPVSWATTRGTLAASSSVTDASGKATVALTGTQIGAATVTAGAVQGSDTAIVTFVADNGSARVVSLTANPTTIVANGSDSSDLVAVVQDSQGNPVGAGISVSWSTTRGNLSSATTLTDNEGKARNALTGTQAGAASITASAVGGSATAGVTLIPDASTARVVGLVATPNIVAANGIATSQLVATVQDANGNLVEAGVNVDWSTTRGNLSAASSSTDASGKARATISSTQAGAASVTASAVMGSDSAPVTFTYDDATAKVVSLVATPNIVVANGTSASQLEAIVEDAQGNPVGAGVTVSWSTTHGNLSVASSVTDDDGKAVAQLTSTQSGAATVTAAAVGGSASAGVSFIADASTAKVVGLVAVPTTVAADGTSSSQLEATVEDAHGNRVDAGVNVNWSATRGDLSVTSSSTDANGKARASISSTQVGASTVTASAVAGSDTANVTFIPDAASAKVVSLVATPNTIVANGTSTSQLEATVVDGQGNSVGAGITVTWSSSIGNVSVATSVTNASGKATASLSGTQAGDAVVTASAVAGSASDNVRLIADVTTARVISAVASPNSIVANGISASTVTATVVDAHGNNVGAGVEVDWSATDGTLSQASTSTNSAGKAVVVLISSTNPGEVVVTASAIMGSADATVNFTVDASKARVVAVVANPTSIVANGSSTSTLTATVEDNNGNSIGAGVTVNWTTSKGTLAGSSSVTGSNGKATITLTSSTVVEIADVTASAAQGSSAASVSFIADEDTARVVSVSASPTSIPANGTSTSTLVALVQDANGNPVPGLSVAWGSSFGTLNTASTVTMADGRTSVILTSGTSAATAVVTASARAGNAQANVLFVPDAATARVIALTASPSSVVADGNTVSTLTATIADANGNQLNTPVQVNWTTGLGTLSASSSMSDFNGQAQVTLKSATAGTANVTAATSAVPGVVRNTNVEFTPNAPVITGFNVNIVGICSDTGEWWNSPYNDFTWSATNATRYEVWLMPRGILLYSGTSPTGFHPAPSAPGGGEVGWDRFELRVFNGPGADAPVSKSVDSQFGLTYNECNVTSG